MEIRNKENFITNKQLIQILDLLGESYKPRRILVFEKRFDYLDFIISKIHKFSEHMFQIWSIIIGEMEADYNPFKDSIGLFLFSVKVNTEEGQADIIYEFVRKLRRRHYFKDEIKEEEIKIGLYHAFELNDIAYTLKLLNEEQYRELINKFTINFMNNNSAQIAEIMGWKEEWTFEE